MSTDYDLYCVNCKTDTGVQWNHGNRDLAFILKLRSQLEALGVGLKGLVGEWRAHDALDNQFARFFAEHVGHEIRVRDEYGRFPDECNEYINCECGSRRYCKLPEKHEGAHSPVKRLELPADPRSDSIKD